MAAGEVFYQVAQGQAGINDILDDKDMSSFNTLFQILRDSDDARGPCGISVTGNAYEVKADGHGDVFGKVC